MNNVFMNNFIGKKYDIETEENLYENSVIKEVYDGWLMIECDDEDVIYLNLLYVVNIIPSPIITEISEDVADKPKRGFFKKMREDY